MAEASQPATKKKAKRKRPKLRGPYDRVRVSQRFPEQGRTKQSFRDECDVNQIVDKFARTGIVTSVARGRPEYGDVPDQSLFEAACVQAELRSAAEEGRLADLESSQTPSEAAEDDISENLGDTLGSEEKEPENGSQAADDESRA